MKYALQLLLQLLLPLLLLFGLFSCANPNITAQLNLADSLFTTAPDSAYTLLKSVDPNQLRGDKQHAQYALLLTKAQYKTSDLIVSDSLIEIAVNYYKNGKDKEKRTQAYLYKGAVLAEMGLTREAIDWYKKTEQVADTTDFMTMGLLNFRMAELYQKSYINNDEHIKRYKYSLAYFRKAKHLAFENYVLSAIGQQYCTRNYESAYLYLNHSLELAKRRRDKQEYSHCCFVLSKFYDYHNTNLHEAKNLALVVYQNRDSIRVGNDLYSHLSMMYSKIGKVDSAKYFAAQFSKPISAIDTVNYFMMQEELALAKDDYKTAFQSYKISERIADSLLREGKSEEYYYIDKQYDNHVIKAEKAQLEASTYIMAFIIIIAILSFMIIALLWFFYSKRKRSILVEKEQFIDNLQNNLQNILETINHEKQQDNTLKNIIETRVSMIKKLLNIKYMFGAKPTVFFDKFNELIALNQKSQDDCDDIIRISNYLYSNVVDHIEKEHPQITPREKLLISLVCLKFSPVEMLVFLNLTNLGSVYNLRSQLLKKLNTDSLEVYTNDQIRSLQ